MASQLDVQPVKDNNDADMSSTFFNGCREAQRYTVNEVIGKGRCDLSTASELVLASRSALHVLRDQLPFASMRSYGTVCAAVDNLTGEKVAIKRIQNVFDNVADATRILREIKLLRLLKHPDVVEIKHIMLPPEASRFKDIYVVFELMESDLHTVIGANDDLTAGEAWQGC